MAGDALQHRHIYKTYKKEGTIDMGQ